MPTVTKQIQLTPLDIFAAIQQLTLEELSQLRALFEDGIEYDSEHDLPKSFVKELKEGLDEARRGNVEPFDFSVTEE